ncbi:hypothetical protein [Leucothrix arctica]|uniref:Uncharacterized protein n=1 Tax=Leucothrix arctica TaxID=1481894 RepID=A0A317CE70_9GAMM|nr:hypothetical protein [Leucothrix arctica]PWQ94590.1 hypothetical protein DKT75_14945 [Leucothrix arctica]
MEMLTFPVIIAVFLVTLFLTSHIAKQVHGKYWKMPVVFMSWVVGGLLAFLALVSIDVLPVAELDPTIILVLKYALPFLVSTIVLMVLVRLDFMSAFTVNAAGLFIGLILAVVAIVSLGHSIESTVNTGNIVLQTAKANVVSMITGKPVNQEALAKLSPVEVEEEIELEPVYTTKDFLPPSAQKALEVKEQKIYTQPHYRDINVLNARRVIGKRVRASWRDGKVSVGKLEAVEGGDLIVSLRREEGIAQVPISMSSLKKLEVFR